MSFQKKIAQIEALAFEIIRDLEIKKPPINIKKVVKKFGLELSPLDLKAADVSGVLVISKNSGTIGFNPNEHILRQRFTIAHELGHYLLHKTTSELFVDRDFLVKYRNTKNTYTATEYLQEQEANAFAASLLMPKKYIDEKLAKKEYLELSESSLINKLAKDFKVSTPAMTYRLSNLNSNYFIQS